MDLRNDTPSPDRRVAGGRIRRRTLVTAGLAGALSLALPAGGRKGGLLSLGPSTAPAAAPKAFRSRLPIPKVLTGDHIVLPIREASVPILPGRETRMWTYDGTFPGPTIRRPAGQEAQVTFVHRLPRSVGQLSVHLHGGHTSSADDGQPGGLTQSQPKALYCELSRNLSPAASGNNLLISPGERRTYTYGLTEDGSPERAAFQWYHDHRLERTAPNVWHGLAGMFILDDDFEAGLDLPSGRRDIPLLITDRSFDRHNQLTNPFGRQPPDDGVTGKYVLVNGAYAPFARVAARRYRLRILNASNFRAYQLKLSNGAPMTQIATESGLMPQPLVRRQILLGPAERVEVVVDLRNANGKNVELRSGGTYDGEPHLGPHVFQGPMMQFRVGDRVPDSSSVPPALRPLPGWVADAVSRWQSDPTPDHSWQITLRVGLPTKWLINGKTFDPSYVDHQVPVGSTQIWRLKNSTSVSHMFHIHMTDWYCLELNGQPPPPQLDCLKETFFLNPHDEMIVAGHLTDHLGKFVVHCHMLDHEDHGLMSQFEVV